MRHHIHLHQPTMVVLVMAALAMAIQGTWNIDIAHHWAFISVMAAMLVLSFWQAFRQHHHSHHSGNWASHAGMGLLILTMIAGVPWNESGQAIATRDKPTNILYTTDRRPLVSPFEVQLGNLDITYYNDCEHVKQYLAILRVSDLTYSDTTFHVVSTSVNHPAEFMGYHIYLDSCDAKDGQYAVLKIVKEPLMPLIYIAFALLAIGVIMQIVTHWREQSGWIWGCVIGIALIFTVLSILRIHFGHLMPALRSAWFIPHLGFYMIAYALLAINIVLVIVMHYKPDTAHPHYAGMISSLLHTASALLLLGMLCGAIWAKQAWGDYWTWDPKECWAAATWFLCLAATHSRRDSRTAKLSKTRIVMMILCFLAMQITWYGVNYLPSAKESLHTYNKVES